MPQHNANEQYLLELINAERAEAGVQPLAFDTDLSESAEDHSQWMLATDRFSHTGSGGSSPTERMRDAGYSFDGSWASGENIAWATTRGPSGTADEVLLLHDNLMNSPGHRANILNGNFREVGLGFEVGDYRGRDSAFVTENFAKTGSDIFLTGVAFDDRDDDVFYDPGEGLAGITITAKNSAGNTFTTTTSGTGGYDLSLKPGSYTVTFSGPDIESSTQNVTIGSRNAKLDLVDPEEGGDVVAGPVDPIDPAPEPQPEPTPEPEPTPTPQPDPEPAPPQFGGSDGVDWLAKFFGRWGGDFSFDRTLAAHEKGEPAPGTNPQMAFDGDAISFPTPGKLAVVEQFVEDVQGEARNALDQVADARFPADWAEAALAFDDADALASKILEQVSAHAGANADATV